MTLEEVMLFSLVYSLGTFDGINIDETIRQSYIEALNENELFKDLVYKLNNYFFYEKQGNKLFKTGQSIWQEVMKMPNPLQFEKLIDKTTNLVEEIELSNDYSVRKIENTFFWNESIDVLDKKIDRQEYDFFRKIIEIDLVTSCMFMDILSINIIDTECNNANDMQRSYIKMLKNISNITKDAWIITEVINENDIVMYALKYVEKNVLEEYIRKYKAKPVGLNLWVLLDKHREIIKGHTLSEIPLFCGVGRLTNVGTTELEYIKQGNIVTEFDVSKNIKVDFEASNPIQIINDYLGNSNIKYTITSELFVELLNMQLINRHYDNLIQNHKCLICGKKCKNGRSICYRHIEIEK